MTKSNTDELRHKSPDSLGQVMLFSVFVDTGGKFDYRLRRPILSNNEIWVEVTEVFLASYFRSS